MLCRQVVLFAQVGSQVVQLERRPLDLCLGLVPLAVVIVDGADDLPAAIHGGHLAEQIPKQCALGERGMAPLGLGQVGRIGGPSHAADDNPSAQLPEDEFWDAL